MIETRLMNYFLAVAREQNITKAAEVLNITQPTLSKQLQELESQLGKKLFIRTSKNTILTEDGVYFRAKTQEIIDLVEKEEKNMKEGSDNPLISYYMFIMMHLSCQQAFGFLFHKISKNFLSPIRTGHAE